jgi:peptide/nickel transport system ATP-binding protein
MDYLETINVSKAYTPGKGSIPVQVLNNISLVVKPGETIGITGCSGAGKTTLGLILTGIIPPDKGRLCFNGIDFWHANTIDRKQINRRLQMVFQHPESTFDPRWTIRKTLCEPFMLNNIKPDFLTLANRLSTVGLDFSVLDRRPHQLSGGELQRIAIARVMILHPAVVVLDEPTAMLDVLTQARIMGLLKQIQQNTQVGYILISHDNDLVQKFCHRVFRLENACLISEP